MMRCVRTDHFASVFVFSILLVAVSCRNNTDQFCLPETNDYNSNTNITWFSKNINNEIVTSVPPCLNSSDQLVLRTCNDGTWSPMDSSNSCERITTVSRCPTNFVETENNCRFITEPRPWGNICSFEALTHISATTILKDKYIWLPYKRLTKYGPFESVTRGKDLGKVFNKPLNATIADPDFFSKHCLMLDTATNEYLPEYCDQNHIHICEFSKKDANSRCPDDCVSADIVSERCYCKRRGFCPYQLSKIETMFDLTVLMDLADDDVCYVNSDLPPQLGKSHQGLGRNFWFYTNLTLKCSLCTTSLYKSYNEEDDVEMVLNFDDKERDLFLTVYSPEGLVDKGYENTIYCYTDANKYILKKKVDVEDVVHYRKENKSYNVYKISLEDYIGNYWCEAYKNVNEENIVVSNTVLAYKVKKGNEYSLRLTIKSICVLFPCDDESFFKYEAIISNTSLVDLKSLIRVMNIFSFDFENMDLLLHITTNYKMPVVKDYELLKDSFKNKTDIEVSFLRSSEYCLPEIAKNLTWPLTLIGQGAVAEEMCLQENGLPVVRFCRGKFLEGGEWSDIVGDCHKDIEVPESTKYIQSTLKQNISNEIISNVTTVIKSNPDLPVLSVYMVSKFLDSLYYQLNSSMVNGINSAMEITDSLLNVNKNSLVNAQELLNVTDELLDLLDNILTDSTKEVNVLLLQKGNLIIHITNPLISNVSGLVVYQEEGKDATVKSLPRNSTFENLGPDVLIAVVVPEDIITHKNASNITIITTIYFKDTFFESNYSKKPSGPVVSVTIPEFGCYLPSAIPIMFKISNYTDTPECGFWDYGKKSGRRKGRWSTVGGNYLGEFENQSTFHVCSFSHLTHFSLLHMTMSEDLNPIDDKIMDIIIYLGGVISVIGLLGIFVTAIMFKRWRQKRGTIILLNLSVAIFLEAILIQISDTSLLVILQGCEVLGILLHYVVISKFAWMLVYSFLQYMRFVKVLYVLPENIVLKSVLFGWGFGLIPVIIVNIITSTAYTIKEYNFCYATGLYLYLGTLMPVLLIVFINTYVFVAVMREVTSKNVESHGNKDNIHKLQVQLAVLLFFVLGVPWIFFVLANIIPISWLKIALAYLFCLTSDFQGFILFLFYVVFNTETRIAWLRMFKKNRSKSFSISTKFSSKS